MMGSSSSRQRFGVFEFSKEDDRVESLSERILKKFGNPKYQNSPVTKYKFLEFFTRGTKTCQEKVSEGPIDVDDDSGVDYQCSSNDHDSRNLSSEAKSFSARDINLGVSPAGSKCLDSDPTQSLSNCEPIGVISDDESITPTFSSEPGENKVSSEEPAECGFGGCKIYTPNNTVVLCPDFVMYGDEDICCTNPWLTFSCSGVRLEGSELNGNKYIFSSEWTIGNIIEIESQWCASENIANVILHLKPKDTRGAPTEGNKVLKFAVCDPHWFEMQDVIKSLDVRYNAIWNSKFDFNELFKDLIYPEGDPDAVSISKRDIELLQPETFINDTIIDFYIKYLKNKQAAEKHRFHFFNSFFFRKLADLDKDPSSIRQGRAAFQRVRKWTRKVNLFEKDYIFIPVNFRLHWSLIVICHPGEVANFKDEEIQYSPKVPCILHMDSKEGSHKGLKNLVQRYLFEEWRERQSETAKDISSKFLNLRFVPLELPQQGNLFDCGLFLLHYVELFLEKAPVNFSPFQITKSSNFLTRDWFPPAEASRKRAKILKLIFQILEGRSRKISPPDCHDKCPSSQLAYTSERETVMDLVEDNCNWTKTCSGIPSSAHHEQGIESSIIVPSPPHGVKHIGKIGLFSELFEQGAMAGSLSNEHYRQSIMTPIQEVEEVEEQVAYSPSGRTACHNVEVDEQVAEIYKTSHCTKNSIAFQTYWNPGIYMHREELDDKDSSYGFFVSVSRNSSEVDEYHLLEETVGSHQETDKQESGSMSSEDFADCVVEDSLEADGMSDGNESEGSLSSCQGNGLAFSEKRVYIR